MSQTRSRHQKPSQDESKSLMAGTVFECYLTPTWFFVSYLMLTDVLQPHRYKSNEDYVYVRGRGRGKYICEECGIRCKKPSMLRKHIRTHSDVRPYHCTHCNFSFKTKGERFRCCPVLYFKAQIHKKYNIETTWRIQRIDN